jgi:hypothetical protein
LGIVPPLGSDATDRPRRARRRLMPVSQLEVGELVHEGLRVPGVAVCSDRDPDRAVFV